MISLDLTPFHARNPITKEFVNVSCALGPQGPAGRDGRDGKSVAIKGSLENSSQLPSTGQQLGDGYLINGDLWVYSNSSEIGSINGFVNVGRIQGPDGVSITDVVVNQNNHLIITLSNGQIIDAGATYDDSGLVLRVGNLERTVGDISTILASVVEVNS